jgi:hypothetical protein
VQADAAVLVVCVLALVAQPWFESLPWSFDGSWTSYLGGIVCSVWLAAIIARPKWFPPSSLPLITNSTAVAGIAAAATSTTSSTTAAAAAAITIITTS